MEQYIVSKNNINDKLLFKLSQIGYALNCDMLFTRRLPGVDQDINLVNNLKTGDKIFISVLQHEIPINLNTLVELLMKKNIQVYFYLMSEPIVPLVVIQMLFPVSLGFYLNNNVYNHPLIHGMPIGIRDCGKVCSMHEGFTHDYLHTEGLKTVTKEYLALLCFTYSHRERHRCYQQLKDKKFVLNLNDGTYEKQPSALCGKVPVWINYEYTHKSFYVLSPRGTGEDCHRFYEAIYLDSIPIVKKTNTPFDKMYDVFPCLVVNDWNEITEDLLLANKERCIQKLVDFKTKYPNAFTDLSSIDELLNQT